MKPRFRMKEHGYEFPPIFMKMETGATPVLRTYYINRATISSSSSSASNWENGFGLSRQDQIRAAISLNG